MATADQIRDRAANDLGLLRLGQSLQSQDATRISSAYEEVYAQLKKEGLATWAFSNEVPDEMVPFVVSLVANNCLNTYSVPDERYKRIKLESQNSLREIRKFTVPTYVSNDDPTDY